MARTYSTTWVFDDLGLTGPHCWHSARFACEQALGAVGHCRAACRSNERLALYCRTSAPTPHRSRQILPDDGSCALGTVTYCRAAYLFDDQVLVCVQHMRCAQALGLQGLQSCSIELQINTTKYSRERIRAGLGDSGLLPGRVSLRRLGCACLVRHPRLMTRNSRKLCGNRTELKLPGIEIYYTNYLISLAKNMLCSKLYRQQVFM